ncbi:MAG: glycoside hydrolase family 3 C-terminal domain-containing protein [Kiritimatiellae bacterium]|nr:glycoside hydrolase family 3 C-terminal domain-containing protein [Kiritimatiellia bacterium]
MKNSVAAAVAFLGALAAFAGTSDPAAMEKAREILSKMTLEEKVSLCAGSGTMTLPAVPRVGIDREWTMSDSSHTVRADMERWTFKCRSSGDEATVLPTLSALASTWNTDLAERFGHVIGREARARGKDMMLGPGVNIMRTPLCGRNWEYLSEDPCLAAKIAVPEIKALQSHGVAACVKHFAVNSQENDRMNNNAIVDDRTMNEIYLPVFRAAVKEAGVMSLMTSYNLWNGCRCAEHDYLIKGILRERWGFDGLITTDWGAQRTTVKSALSGAGVEMDEGKKIRHLANPANGTYPLADAVKEGKVPECVVDEKALRVLYTMARTGFFEPEKREKGERLTGRHRAEALAIAEEAIVLLKNDRGELPLNPAAMKKIIVVGRLAATEMTKKGWSATGKPLDEITPWEGLIEYFKGKGVELERYPLADFPADLEKKARGASAVIVFTGTELGHGRALESEGGDRPDMKLLPKDDEAVKKILSWKIPNTVVVNHSGSPVEMPWVEDCPTLVQQPYLGEVAGRALARTLFGDVNPSGRLPCTWPRRYEDTAVARMGTVTPKHSIYNERFYVGYRWFDKTGIEPMFPFGYGLSYTEFELAGLKAEGKLEEDGVKVSVCVRNTGKTAGKAVVQLYASYPDCGVERCVKELKGFAKTPLLQPGETGNVEITVSARDLAYWDDIENCFKTPAGSYRLTVGASSRDERGSIFVTLPESATFSD